MLNRFSFVKKEKRRLEVELCTFGKLPICADFDLTVGGESARGWYVDWIEQGRKRYEEAVGSISFRHGLLLSPADQGQAIIAVIEGSRDKAGRRYPFTVYVSISNSWVLAAMPAVAQGLWPVWEGLGKTMDVLQSCPDRSAFLRYLSEHRLALPPAPSSEEVEVQKQDCLAVASSTWLEGMLGDSTRLRAGAFLQRARRCLEIAKERPVAVRVPLGRTLEVAPQIDFWLQAVLRAGGNAMEVPTILFPCNSAGERPSFSLLHRPTESIDYLLFNQDASSSKFVEDLRSLPSEGQSDSATQLDDWLQNHPTLSSVLEVLAGSKEG